MSPVAETSRWLLAAAVLAFLAVQAGPARAEADPATPAPAAGSKTEAGAGAGFGPLNFGSGSKEPIVIDADRLDFDYQDNKVTYRGKVHATQGEITIDSDTLIVTFTRADEQKTELREVVAQGNVVITQGTRKATGETATFTQKERQIVLVGNPVLRDGKNEVAGDKIVVLLDEGRSIVESSPKKRVSAILYPGSENGLGAESNGAKAPIAVAP